MVRTLEAEPRRKEAESEKITINLGFVDLGHIDLLVEEGFYSNRTDFIRTAIRNQVLAHADVLKHSVARRSMVLGLQRFTRQDLEKVLAAGEQLHIQVLGLATIDDDVPAQLASRAIGSITVLGALRASPQVKAVLADRTR
jgi:Arc/MetJ-type ribon-helix-helix transcriptional regulator